MIKNYFKTAWRNLWKNKTFSVINIAGLAIGMAACLLILQYVSFELSYDQFNKKASDIYRRLLQAMRKLFAVGGGFEPPRGS